jgi:ubiquinone/menaquinone biosynthesis C-methylase UbiE
MSDAVDAFDEAAKGYDDWYATEKGRQVFSAEKKLLTKLLPRSGVGVEIGAGTGAFSEALSTSRDVICLDLSREMLTKASGKGLPCILGSADKIPIRDDSLGFAYMVTVVEFLKEPVAVFKEASRVTTHDAPVVALTINADSSWGNLYSSMALVGDPIFSHATLYTPPEIDAIGSLAGLHSVKALGTLTTDPTSPKAGDKIVEPSAETGVTAIKFTKP